MAMRARLRTFFFLCMLAVLGAATPLAQAQLRETKLVPSDGAKDDFFGEAIAIDGNRIVVGVRTADIGGVINAGAAYVFERINGVWKEVQKLVPSVSRERDFFGESVALDGDRMLIGAVGNDDRAEEGGAVYVFERIDGMWQEVDILYAISPRAFHFFGWEVVLDGDRAFIGAPRDDDIRIQAGAVYFYEQENGAYVFRQKLAPDNNAFASFFGTTMGLDGNYLVVGSPTDSEAGPQAGAAYIFELFDGQWQRIDKLLPPPVALPDSVDSDTFSREVALNGDWALVGSSDDERCINKPLFDPQFPNSCTSGAVFAYQRQASGQWILQQKIAPDELEQFDFFGFVAIAIEDGRAAIGARGDDDACPNPPPPNPYICDTGAIYLYELMGNMWEKTGKLTASDADSLDIMGGTFFGQGRPLGISRSHVVAGAPSLGFSDDISTVGKAYVFKIFNRDPVARADAATTQEDAPVTIDVFANDEEPDLDPVTLSIAVPPANGAVVINPVAAGKRDEVGTITYTPNPGFSGTDSFTYRLEDIDGGSGEAIVTVTVLGPANRPPSTPAILEPAPGATVVIGGAPGEPPLAPSTPFVVTWSQSVDPDGDTVFYQWQLASDTVFVPTTVLLTKDVGETARLEMTLGDIAAVLNRGGVGLGSEVALWHQVRAFAGGQSVFSPATEVRLLRGTLTATEADVELPTAFALEGNYPNPFNPATRIDFALPRAATVRLAVYDALGREQAVLVEGRLPAGRHHAVFEAGELPSGVYLYRLEVGGEVFMRAMLLLK